MIKRYVVRIDAKDILGNSCFVIAHSTTMEMAKHLAECRIIELGEQKNFHWEPERVIKDLSLEGILYDAIYDHEMGGDPRF